MSLTRALLLFVLTVALSGQDYNVAGRRAFDAPALNHMHDLMFQRSRSYKQATLLIMFHRRQALVIMNADLPRNEVGVTVLIGNTIYVLVDNRQCMLRRKDPKFILAHEMRHAIDISEDAEKYKLTYAAQKSYATNVLEIEANKWAAEVLAEAGLD